MGDQLLPQLLMEQFDTLPIQCRHIKHICMKEFIIFVCTDSTEIFSKLRSGWFELLLAKFFH